MSTEMIQKNYKPPSRIDVRDLVKIAFESIKQAPKSQMAEERPAAPHIEVFSVPSIFSWEVRADVCIPIAKIDMEDPRQRATMEELRSILDLLAIDRNYHNVMNENYGQSPLFDVENSRSRLGTTHLNNENEREALGFFTFGNTISLENADAIFKGRTDAIRTLLDINIIVAETGKSGEIMLRMNNLSVTPQKLPNNEVMYLFTDLPTSLQTGVKRPATAQLSETSYITQSHVIDNYYNWKNVTGVAADFGSGVGIQAITLLMLNPAIERAICLEIDPRSMELNRVNAMLNGVADQVMVVDNLDPKNLERALGGKKIALVVSNPPFNTVPHEHAAEFTDFGDGGDTGLDVTKIFLEQALPNMADGAYFFMYSVLAKDESGRTFLEKYIANNADFSNLGLKLQLNDAPPDVKHNFTMDVTTYAQALALYFLKEKNNYPTYADVPRDEAFWTLALKIDIALQDDGVRGVQPYLLSIKRDDIVYTTDQN